MICCSTELVNVTDVHCYTGVDDSVFLLISLFFPSKMNKKVGDALSYGLHIVNLFAICGLVSFSSL